MDAELENTVEELASRPNATAGRSSGFSSPFVDSV
jgi:hypothetical protein